MPDLTIPHNFTNGTTADAEQVDANFNAVKAVVDDLDNANIAAGANIAGSKLELAARPITLLGRWDLVSEVSPCGGVSLNNAQHYLLAPALAAPIANGAASFVVATWYPDAADFAVSGLTPKLRVVGFVQTNATAPAVTFTFGLHVVTSAAGGAGFNTTTINTTPVTGSAVAIASPVANGSHHANGTAFSVPSTGPTTAYCFGLAVNGTMAANSAVRLGARLEVHYE